MVKLSVFIELGIAIAFVLGYFVYFIVKYRKTPGFVGVILWGFGAFLISNAVTNIFNMGFQPLLKNGTIPNNPFIILAITSLTRAIGLVFAAFFVIKTLKKRNNFTEGVSDDAIGFMTGSGTLFSPINNNAHLIFLITMFTNALVVNKNPTQEQLGDIPLATVQAAKEMFDKVQIGEFLMFALHGIGLALASVLIFKLVTKVYNKKKGLIKYGLPILFGFVYSVLVEGATIIPVMPMLVNIVIIAVIIVGFKALDYVIDSISNA